MADFFAMKTLGAKVREFREHPSRQWSAAELAQRVGTTRQSIENLEHGLVRLPHYIVKLADVMDSSVDDLLNRPAKPHAARMDVGTYSVPTLESALDQIGLALAALPDAVRPAVADNLAGWSRDRGSEHYRDVLLLLLQRPHARRP